MKNSIIGRRKTRELVVQFLFQNEFNPMPVNKAFSYFWDENKIIEKEKTFAEKLINGVLDKKDELDKILSNYTNNWKTERLGSVDLIVMRIALFEILYCDDVPPIVAINEAVHFANDLSSFQSGKFVNGVLDSILHELDYPQKTSTNSNDQ
tara:strand:- start:519 stop:971 length:453 start_codon:yes stop_codon:yes gene_type:complete